ncbi:MAG: SBBP repeat-containing protein [Bryobacteraceae bacterium]
MKPILLLVIMLAPLAAQQPGFGLDWLTQVCECRAVVLQTVATGSDVWAAGFTIEESEIPTPAESFAADAFVARLDGTGRLKWFKRLGGSRADRALAIAVDRQGYAWVGGYTYSPDFPLRRAVQTVFPVTDHGATGFAARLNGDGEIEVSTFFGGNRDSRVQAVAVDDDGAAYVTGVTETFGTIRTFFPTSSGAPITTMEGNPFGTTLWAFAAKFPPLGERIVYSTLLGGHRVDCGISAGSRCIPAVPSTAGAAVAVDGEGRAFVTGRTTALNFPVTSDAFRSSCDDCRWRSPTSSGEGFLTVINRNGTAWEYSTYFGGPAGSDSPVAVVLGPARRVTIAGNTASCTFPTTEGVLQPRFPIPCPAPCPGPCPPSGTTGFIVQFDLASRRLIYSTLFGEIGTSLTALMPHGDGSMWVSAVRSALLSPDYAPRKGDVVARLNPTATALWNHEVLPAGLGGLGLSLTPDGAMALAGGGGGTVSKIRFQAGETPAFTSAPLTIAPGEWITLHGVNLGPAATVGVELDSTGKITTRLHGMQAFFNGIAAPVVLAQNFEMTVAVPSGVPRDQTIPVEVVKDDRLVGRRMVKVVEVNPRILGVANADGSINSLQSRTRVGEVLSVYATGVGDMTPPLEDGAIAAHPLAVTRHPIEVLLNGLPAEVLYSGAAPVQGAGIVQVNARVFRLTFGTETRLQLRVNGVLSPLATVYIDSR